MALSYPLDDQKILEEDYDENYEPTEEGKSGHLATALPWSLA